MKTCSCGSLTVYEAPVGIGFICSHCRDNVVLQPAPEEFTLYLRVA